ncbi:Mur ligase family protein [Methanobacterium sp. CWC-01]|uniref:Mur ligase family protein n=1 Tax=Methanobacterium aridiramus TaxID=2584467 RepID=UPI00257582C1|nr:Mur ligase family protein [Methanobacterium sp. CWC-01]
MGNSLRYHMAVLAGKTTSFILKKVLKGEASAMPGKVAMKIDPHILQVVNQRCQKKILVTGTNGKTTTTNLLSHIISSQGLRVLSNLRGANMPQGLVSSFLNDLDGEYDWGVFEVDEGSFQEVVKGVKPDYVVVTNFFRDQLDRYGEIEKAFQDISDALEPLDTTLILNADDPLVSNFKNLKKRNIFYGVGKNQFSNQEEGVIESRFCPSCASRLEYDYFNYGQLGSYYCNQCGFTNPHRKYEITRVEYADPGYHLSFKTENVKSMDLDFSYDGIFNTYNCCAALAAALEMGLEGEKVIESIGGFEYYLGRMESFQFPDKLVKVVLVKNPIGLGEVLRSLSLDEKVKSLLMVLNDNPADGTDISWIWDAQVENILQVKNLERIYFSGRRAEDMALRLKYADQPPATLKVDYGMDSALEKVLNEDVEIVYILPTYTAVFHIRELLIARMGGSSKFMSYLRESLKNLKLKR